MYQENDHISNLFRENEHLLDERPSRNAWAKLEEKLDQEKARSTRRIYRYISTAAAVVAVVAMISAIALFKNGDAMMAEKNAKKEAIALNEQSTEYSVNDNASDWRKEYAPKSIEQAETNAETEKTKIITTENTSKEQRKTKNIPFENIIEEKQIIADNTIENDNETYTSIKKEEVEKPRMNESTPTTAKPSKSNVVAPVAKAKTEKEEIAAAEPANEKYGNFPDKTMTNSSDNVEVGTRKELEKKKTESYNNANKPKTKALKPENPTINTFAWLKGAWADNTTLGLSYEKWEQTDSKTLTAKGYLIQNGDTLFVEQMQIKEIKNRLYYIATFQDGKAPTKFELVSYSDGIATFKNPNSDFPSQIILQKDGNGYLITFENADDFEQNKQLQYRNNISRARASRRMTRSGY